MSIDFSGAPRAWEKEKSNFVALLDLKLESVEHGKAVMRMPYRTEITNGTGAVHGGAIVSLCERSSMSRSPRSTAASKIPRRSRCSATSWRRPVRRTISIAEARVLRGGRRIVYGEVYVRSGTEIVAHATLDFLNSYPDEETAQIRQATSLRAVRP